MTAKYWSMPLTDAGRETLLRFVLAIIAGCSSDTDHRLWYEVRSILWNKPDRLELEQFAWSQLQLEVERWGLNSESVSDKRDANRFCCAVDAMLRRPPVREVELAKPVETVDVPAVVYGKQKTLWE